MKIPAAVDSRFFVILTFSKFMYPQPDIYAEFADHFYKSNQILNKMRININEILVVFTSVSLLSSCLTVGAGLQVGHSDGVNTSVSQVQGAVM